MDSPTTDSHSRNIIADALGVGFSVVRSTLPGLAEKLDFRLEYVPSGHDEFNPAHDYSGQKYVLALNSQGLSLFVTLPPHLEFQTGYYARGFTMRNRKEGITESPSFLMN